MTKKGAMPRKTARCPEEILRMQRRISAMMGRLQRIPPPWTPEQERQWNRLYEINLGISWCLGSDYIFYPFVPKEAGDD